MTAASVVASVVLGAAFVVAGASKLAIGQAWPAQARGLGAPTWVARPLPWLELALGAVLVVQLARQPAAIVAIVVLLAFTALIVRRLAGGEHPPCACFGAWSARPLGWRHVARNAVLLAIGVLAAL